MTTETGQAALTYQQMRGMSDACWDIMDLMDAARKLLEGLPLPATPAEVDTRQMVHGILRSAKRNALTMLDTIIPEVS